MPCLEKLVGGVWLLAGVLVVSGVPACAEPNEPEQICGANTPCPDGLQCVSSDSGLQVCRDQGAELDEPYRHCDLASSDCPEGSECVQGPADLFARPYCAPTCDGTEDSCERGECRLRIGGAEATHCIATCTSSQSCPGGQQCLHVTDSIDLCAHHYYDRFDCPPSVTCDGPCSDGRCERVLQLAAGSQHTCARLADSTVMCWGRNDDGQLARVEGTLDSTRPGHVLGIYDATSIAAGAQSSCAAGANGATLCWGKADGNALRLNLTGVAGPAFVQGGSGASQLSVGGFDYATQACGVFGTEIKCWGANTFGEVGVSNDILTAKVTKITDGVQVSRGRFHACGVRDGSVYCWGAAASGELGFEPEARCSGFSGGLDCQLTPRRVEVDDVVRVEGGGRHTCALTADENLWCWGRDTSGALGVGEGYIGVPPTRVNVSRITDFALGQEHTCAIANAGVICWGDNSHGQVGVAEATEVTFPEPVPLPALAVEIVAGDRHTCARLGDGTVYCWGDNEFGQLGDGTTEGGAEPRAVVW